MITPRTTRLVRVSDLCGLRAVASAFAERTTPFGSRRRGILVPTRGAAEWLRRTIDAALLDRGLAAWVLPQLLTRGDLYARLHDGLPGAPPLLSDFDREVLFRRAARAAAVSGATPPFRLRPGLVVALLAFYDELRRRDRSVRDFDRLMTESLAASADYDRGAERMLRQTRFLAAAFSEFERLVDASGAIDEHGLRARLVAGDRSPGLDALLVTVADQPAEATGLWTADFDLLARIPGLQTLEIAATERVLAAGFHERIHHVLPGIEEVRGEGGGARPVLLVPAPPSLAAPAPRDLWFTRRDREEELVDAVARVRTGEAQGQAAVVYARPLPYLYLARHVCAEAGIGYDAIDALPLAAEPFAAALDQIFSVLLSEATRASLVEMLASTHWTFSPAADDSPISRAEVRAADAGLQKARYVGGWDQLDALAAAASSDTSTQSPHRGGAARALAAASRAAGQLRTIAEARTASAQLDRLSAFIRAHEAPPVPDHPWAAAHFRARGAMLDALDRLADAHRRHDDEAVPIAELVGTIRRWIEGQTFSPRSGAGGLALLDARTAPYADPDDVRIVGLVESDWPDRQGRSIFYPASLLAQLGWPSESDRLSAARARFRDLLQLARQRVSLSSFVLEDDAMVAPSAFLEEIGAAGLDQEQVAPLPRPRLFVHEALADAPVLPEAVDGEAAAWLALRMGRTQDRAERFRGEAGPVTIAAHAVSHLERYLECPFKYFAAHVLRLEEERADQAGLTPQERGHLLHDVFERFFAAWHDAGRRAITPENLPDALARFEEVAEARLAALGEADRALERTYLLGSAVASGLAERAFGFEIEHGVGVLERLLEYRLEGEFLFEADGRSRRLAIKGKADRIDLLEDGTLRVIDYKLGRAPKASRALQLPVYGICACQHLEGRHDRSWTVSRAGYVAFRERNAFVPLGGAGSLADALEDGQERLLATVEQIEAGSFPVDPDEPFLCSRCGYAAVCRKDYVGDE